MSQFAAARPDSLADILERVLDRGVVIAGDVSISLVGIELVTIRLRLLIASVDKAQQMGIDWWSNDPTLSADAARLRDERAAALRDDATGALRAENAALKARLEGLEARLARVGA